MSTINASSVSREGRLHRLRSLSSIIGRGRFGGYCSVIGVKKGMLTGRFKVWK